MFELEGESIQHNLKIVSGVSVCRFTCTGLGLLARRIRDIFGNGVVNTVNFHTGVMTMKDLPTSPAARAFFDALDQKASSGRKQSEFIRKRIQTLGWRNRFSQDEYYHIQVNDTKFHVRQIQRGEIEGTYGTGATVWPAALVMIKYLEKHQALVKGKTVIDLGSGTGCTSIAAALLGAKHVVCTDGEENVVQLAIQNINTVAQSMRADAVSNTDNSRAFIQNCQVDVQKLWWGRDKVASTQECDILLVADCVLPKLYPIAPLVEEIDRLLVHPKAGALLSYEHRFYPDYDPRDKFKELAKQKRLKVQIIPMSEQDEVYSVEDIELWWVERESN